MQRSGSSNPDGVVARARYNVNAVAREHHRVNLAGVISARVLRSAASTGTIVDVSSRLIARGGTHSASKFVLVKSGGPGWPESLRIGIEEM